MVKMINFIELDTIYKHWINSIGFFIEIQI